MVIDMVENVIPAIIVLKKEDEEKNLGCMTFLLCDNNK